MGADDAFLSAGSENPLLPDFCREWRRLPATTLTADEEGMVRLTLPDDFLSLMSVRLEGWDCPVRRILPPGHWLRRLQSSRYGGLRGSPQRPLAFFSADSEGRPALELFSSEPSAPVELTEFIYLPHMVVTGCT